MDNNSEAMIMIVRELFQEFLDLENILEMMRKEMSLRTDFNLKSSFLLFHRSPQ